jgi:hypothetical protein
MSVRVYKARIDKGGTCGTLFEVDGTWEIVVDKSINGLDAL